MPDVLRRQFLMYRIQCQLREYIYGCARIPFN